MHPLKVQEEDRDGRESLAWGSRSKRACAGIDQPVSEGLGGGLRRAWLEGDWTEGGGRSPFPGKIGWSTWRGFPRPGHRRESPRVRLQGGLLPSEQRAGKIPPRQARQGGPGRAREGRAQQTSRAREGRLSCLPGPLRTVPKPGDPGQDLGGGRAPRSGRRHLVARSLPEPSPPCRPCGPEGPCASPGLRGPLSLWPVSRGSRDPLGPASRHLRGPEGTAVSRPAQESCLTSETKSRDSKPSPPRPQVGPGRWQNRAGVKQARARTRRSVHTPTRTRMHAHGWRPRGPLGPPSPP